MASGIIDVCVIKHSNVRVYGIKRQLVAGLALYCAGFYHAVLFRACYAMVCHLSTSPYPSICDVGVTLIMILNSFLHNYVNNYGSLGLLLPGDWIDNMRHHVVTYF